MKVIASCTAENPKAVYTTSLSARGHHLLADEPCAFGGQDAGPAPGEYICMALASCTAITLRMYVQRKLWPVETISVKVDLLKSEDRTHSFFIEVSVTGLISDEQKKRLVEIANACPIHRMLEKPLTFETVISEEKGN